jgi:hypothetical protein
MDNHATTLPLFTRALKIRESVMGPNHPDTAGSLNNLAQLHQGMGNHAAALPLATRALKIYESVMGPDHLDTVDALSYLAALHDAMGNYNLPAQTASVIVCAHCGTCVESLACRDARGVRRLLTAAEIARGSTGGSTNARYCDRRLEVTALGVLVC